MVHEQNWRNGVIERPSLFTHSTKHYYAANPFDAKIIFEDDPIFKLTKTMKKECRGKTIYHNPKAELLSSETYKPGEYQFLSNNGEEISDTKCTNVSGSILVQLHIMLRVY